MIRKLFLFHFLLFFVLSTLLYAPDLLTFRMAVVHYCYAVSIFIGFFGVWSVSAYFKIRAVCFLLLFGYYNYLFLTYTLFALGKANLGVPMTLKMIYPYLENYSLLSNLIPTSTLIFAVVGYALILFLVFYVWNKIYQHIRGRSRIKIQPRSIVFVGVLVIFMLAIFLIKFDFFTRKFNEHKINEPSLTLLFFDEAFERQKESGNENAVALTNYTSPKGNGKNVVLIIADALRPDFFQHKEQLTPFVDSLLTRSNFVGHQNTFSTASFSFNGISSILSSSDVLYDQNFFLHDVLKKQGYEINFILSGDMTNFWNLKGHMTTKSVDFYTDGYDSFKNGRSESLNDDQKNILEQLEQIDSYKGVPTFFYFHMMSVHQIGDLQEKYKRFEPSSVDLTSSDFDTQALVNDYKNRMIQLDNYIRKLYKTLEQKGYLEDFVFVITADHGQSLGENGIYFHSKYINYESINIPFIINSNKITDTTQVANQLNIAPTILETLDLKIPQTWKGTSLSDSLPQIVFQKQNDFYSMIWKEQEKVYQFFYDQKVSQFKLFDVSPNSKEKYKDILFQLDESELDSIKGILDAKFKLNLK